MHSIFYSNEPYTRNSVRLSSTPVQGACLGIILILCNQGPLRNRARAPKDAVPSSMRLVIDLDFDEYMSDGDIKKIMKQVQNSYGANRRAKHPVNYITTSLIGRLKTRFLELEGSVNWKFQREEQRFDNIFPKGDIVYLTSDSDNVLMEIDESKVYVIGGLVDHNQQKGLTHRLANKLGLQHARLPIGEFIKMTHREVLAVNHVFEIMLKFLELKDWKAAFLSVIPARKGLGELTDVTLVSGDAAEATNSAHESTDVDDVNDDTSHADLSDESNDSDDSAADNAS